MKQGLAAVPDQSSPDLHEVVSSGGNEVRNGSGAGWRRTVHTVLLVVTAIFFALHFVHLSADFPNYSPWMDWSKYTDEGWYGDAAIRQIQRGSWYVKGDFNPGIALPVWPLLEYALFSITGVSLVAARALSVTAFGGVLIAAYVLLRRCSARMGMDGSGSHLLTPAIGVALLAASPFCYVISRVAILEPLVILLTLLALLAASGRIVEGKRAWTIASLGVVIPLLILTKTTAIFLLPAIAWMLWASLGYRVRPFLRVGVPAAAIAGVIWAAYFGLVVRPHFLEDYRYLFSANAYTGMTRENAISVIEDTANHGFWMGKLLYPGAIGAMLLVVACCKRCFRNPLVGSLLLWAWGYAAFLAYHDNLQPRYFLVIAVPLTLLLPVAVEEAFRGLRSPRNDRERVDRGLFYSIPLGCFLLIFVVDAVTSVGYVLHPEYTFLNAARGVRRIVMADHGHSPLVLSISGSDLSLMTGLPSICDDFGTMSLEQRVATYRPGWYATWNEVDDDKMDALSPLFHLERVAEFPAFDAPERNLLILYRLDPPEEEATQRKLRTTVPKRLRTKIGQQPSASQLEH